LILDQFRLLLGGKKLEPHSKAGLLEILHDDPHLVTYHEFNEVLAYPGWARSTKAFFTHFFGDGFATVEDMAAGVTRVRVHCMLFYGSFSHGFYTLSQLYDRGHFERAAWGIVQLNARPTTVNRITALSPEQGHATGYLVADNPLTDSQRKAAKAKGQRNTERYLAVEYVNFYLAGSMRGLDQFRAADRFAKRMMANANLASLRLSMFNPLWSYMPDAQQKGLLEQLMLKKAYAMVYMAGIEDSFGKDSELASMLVHGKPAIVYVPRTGGELGMPDDERTREKLDNRFRVFAEVHPLRIQCDLNTGVANGVMVCRDPDVCGELLYQIFTNQLKLDIDDDDEHNVFLRERKTKSAIRVVTRSQFLTDSFWNQWSGVAVKPGPRFAP
jgi:hypothetical protein